MSEKFGSGCIPHSRCGKYGSRRAVSQPPGSNRVGVNTPGISEAPEVGRTTRGGSLCVAPQSQAFTICARVQPSQCLRSGLYLFISNFFLYLIYLFPPAGLMGRVVERLKSFHHRGLLICQRRVQAP